MLTLDHIAVSAEALGPGTADVEAALGQPLLPGGVHPDMGTHNRLLSFGPDEYFELIAIDPDAPGPDQPRWFNLDEFSGPTRVTNWICRCPDIEAAIAVAPDGIGVPWQLQRADLRWTMAVPRDGKLPFGGLFPALIQWHGDAHPAPRLKDTGVRLAALRLFSPEADALQAALNPLLRDARVTVIAGQAPRIEAVLSTPIGEVIL
ncbi:VOC family protein [Rhodobacteraceae bacterium N5(2021)]|uniref:VOC family protein n=1 Tax=Gymnodinialimonas phycosphaerae TaxID=2841589 RepID=A0A975TY47_9RHOB|nr:VOC family protein [Gymnodinialimonas phycosphaerae]MBY4893182.1 VOC family protein [Gymnodinialimonas phycosphaerae]